MSIIPKIQIGLGAKKREKISLDFDNSTTANIGSIQPTMCRELVPDSKITVKVSSLCRLASMPTPTFGRMSLRHYHTFVPLKDLWQPFDAMMAGQHYRGSTNFVPTRVPTCNLGWWLGNLILAYSDISIAPRNQIDKPYTITTTNVDYEGNVYEFGEDLEYSTEEEAIRAAQAADVARIQHVWNLIRSYNGWFYPDLRTGYYSSSIFNNGSGSPESDAQGMLLAGSFASSLVPSVSTIKIKYYDDYEGANTDQYNLGVITADGADLITVYSGYYIFFRFKAPLKRLRTIIIGLGWQFSPYDKEEHSVLKLLAYYKAWFSLFSPVREKSFVDTNCYQLIKIFSDMNGPSGVYYSADGRLSDLRSTFENFLKDLMNECYYYLPMDYYSMSVLAPQVSNQENNVVLNAVAGSGVAGQVMQYGSSNHDISVRPSSVAMDTAGATYPLVQRLASRLLTFANKNTVIGRNIREYLKVHFGIDDATSIDTEGVFRVGASRTNIQISDVMSTAENEQGYLGEYAGKGIGYGDSETFDFTTDSFGYFITLTAVVPESGYYQGYLRENRHISRFDFFNPEFDALGYQVLERGEIMDDYNADDGSTGSSEWNPTSGQTNLSNMSDNNKKYSRTGAFGFVPRYSEYKVGRNIVNGDLSLVSLYSSMSPYTVDRRISGRNYVRGVYRPNGGLYRQITKPDFVPTVVYDGFRRIDPTDHLGQYNRIFNYGGNDLDHFIIHNIFNVSVYAPMKSLSTSFDTIGQDENTIDVTHS